MVVSRDLMKLLQYRHIRKELHDMGESCRLKVEGKSGSLHQRDVTRLVVRLRARFRDDYEDQESFKLVFELSV